jgi:hypothetical protein
MNNEQPLLCDLREMPTSEDAGLVCTNVRLVDGRKPTFIDATDSWFLIPFHIVRFVELPLDDELLDEDQEDLLQRIREV